MGKGINRGCQFVQPFLTLGRKAIFSKYGLYLPVHDRGKKILHKTIKNTFLDLLLQVQDQVEKGNNLS